MRRADSVNERRSSWDLHGRRTNIGGDRANARAGITIAACRCPDNGGAVFQNGVSASFRAGENRGVSRGVPAYFDKYLWRLGVVSNDAITWEYRVFKNL